MNMNLHCFLDASFVLGYHIFSSIILSSFVICVQVAEKPLLQEQLGDTGDTSLCNNVKSMIQGFGGDIQRNLMVSNNSQKS